MWRVSQHQMVQRWTQDCSLQPDAQLSAGGGGLPGAGGDGDGQLHHGLAQDLSSQVRG